MNTPKVGEIFYRMRVGKHTKYQVRGIVDDQVVFRHWTAQRGWIYESESWVVFGSWHNATSTECSTRQQLKQREIENLIVNGHVLEAQRTEREP
jgi:hypothetical protein